MSRTGVMANGTCRRDPVPGEPLEVGVARFSGIDGAERAFADARDRDPAACWLDDAAFVEVHRHSRIVVRGSVAGHYVDLDGVGDVIGPYTGRGAAAGAALGLLLGPSALVLVSTRERVGAMSEALAGVAENVQQRRIGPAAQARLRSALADRTTSP
jgi:hypothetical protein